MSKKSGFEKSKWEKINVFKIMTHPKNQLYDIKEKPLMIKPLIVLAILTAISMILIVQTIDVQADPMLSEFKTMKDWIDYYVFVSMNDIFFTIIGSLFFTLTQLIVAKAMKLTVTFVQFMSMNLYLAIIPAVGVIINVLLSIIFNIDTAATSTITSLQTIFNNDGILGDIFSSFDVFIIWQFIIMAIGLQLIGKIPRSSAWTFIVVLFLINMTLELTIALM